MAETSDSTRMPDTHVRKITPEFRDIDLIAARYWRRRADRAERNRDPEGCIEELGRAYQHLGEDLRDAEAKLELALGELLTTTEVEFSADTAVALLITSSLLTLRRYRAAQALAGEGVA